MIKISQRTATVATAVAICLGLGVAGGMATAGETHDKGAASMPKNSTTGKSSDASKPDSSAWLIVPVAMEAQQSDRMSKGCWVRLYSGEDFTGRYITVVGPNSIAELQSPYGTGLNNWESAVVGPNAMVTTYDGDNFAERDAILKAGAHYQDLGDSKLGLFQDIESLRVSCNGGDKTQAGNSKTSTTSTSGNASTSGS